MALEIGAVIRKRRKQLAIGQEELANILGVSAPAVSKWECGKAYPDITLLPIIAKTLKVTVDNLFSYPSALTEEDINSIVAACSDAFDSAGFNQGYALVEKYLSENPNEDLLKYSLGALLSMYSSKAPDGQRDKYLGIAIDLCRPAAESDNPNWQRMAQKLLTSLYIMNNQLDLAEESLHKYTNEEDAVADQTLAIIHLRKNEFDKAEEIYQHSLLRIATECESALTGLAGIAGKKGNDALFVELEIKILELTKSLELDAFPGKGLNPYVSLCYYYAKEELRERTLWALQGLKQSLSVWNTPFDSSKSRLFSHISLGDGAAFENTMNEAILKITAEMKEYPFISESSECMRLIEQIENMANN